MRMLFFAHSGLRYLVLLLGVVALAYFLYGASTGKGSERVARMLGAAFTGFLDLQAVLGIVMVVLGLFYSALLGHLFMMLAAVAVAHAAMVLGRSQESPQRGYAVRAAGVAIALVLIVGGVMAIGRSIFESGLPSMG